MSQPATLKPSPATESVTATSSTSGENGGSTATNTRIPKTLQAVFLASNRGNEVHKPPPKQVAFRTFFRSMLYGSSSNSNKKKNNTTKTTDNTNDSHTSKIEASYQKGKSSSSKSKSSASHKSKVPKPEKKFDDPQAYLDHMMRSRGYSTKRYNTLKTAYHNKPTPLQRASYDLHLIGIIKSGQAEGLDEILKAGISPNPCNGYGESLVHMVCRRGDEKLLQVMIQNGCDIQVADDYGRTPLHDACWAADPAFEAVEMLLNQDVTLLQMTDCRGFLPLTYVRKDHWSQWIDFLQSKKDLYWPNLLGTAMATTDPSIHSTTSTVCEFVEQDPNTRPIPDPANALPLDLANMVASGAIKPEEAIYLRDCRKAKTNADGSDNDDSDDDDGDESDDDDDDDDSDDDYDSDDDGTDITEDEMSELLSTLSVQLGGRTPPQLLINTGSTSPRKE